MANELKVKDGTGTLTTLAAISASDGISTYHALTGTIASSLSSSLSSINTNIASLLAGTVISASVDIITGDTNLITGSIKELSSSLNYNNISTAKYLYDLSSSISTISRTLATGSTITRVTSSTIYNGTGYNIVSTQTRANLIILNKTNGDLYLTISDTGNITAGSEKFSYILTTSGNYYAEQTDVKLSHHLTGSSALSGYVLITETKY